MGHPARPSSGWCATSLNTGTLAASVTAQDFSWSYPGRPQPALNRVSFDIAPGGRVLIRGASGSGKSTLGLALAGLLDSPDDGEGTGTLLVGHPGTAVGVVAQQPEDQTVMARVHDDVAFGLENTRVDPRAMDARITAALAAVGLDVPGQHPTRTLSGGQRQRLSMAGALALRPGLLVLDEPTSSLDAEGVARVVESVGALVAEQPMTVVIIDHNPALWWHLVDTVITLERGELVSCERVTGPAPQPPPAPVIAPPPLGASVLEVRDLVPTRDGVHPTSEAFSCVVHSGEVLALMGANGSGKTTLALTLAGARAPLSGDVVLPTAPHLMSSSELSRALSFVPQNPAHLFRAPTVRAELEARSSDPEATNAASAQWKLEGLLQAHPLSLSGGEKRRLALALSTLNNPPIIILDEPSQSLDSTARSELVATLNALRHAGTAIVMATHDHELVRELGATVHVVTPSVTVPEAVSPPAPGLLDRANPMALVGAALLPALALLSTLDVVSAATAVVLMALILPFLGVRTSGLLVRLSPVLLAAVFAGVTIVLYGQESGEVFWSWGLITVSEGSLGLAVATALRILAIGGPAVVVLSRVDPTKFADALSQQARLPDNFVIGGLAALRLLEVVAGDREMRTAMARIAGRGDRNRLAGVVAEAIAIFVLAIRRSETLSRAMESRGFGLHRSRTQYRESVVGPADYLWVAGGLLLGLSAVGVALWTGNFNAIIG